MLALKLQYYITQRKENFIMCILYILTGGLLFATSGCYATLDHHDGVILPHDVIHTSHLPPNVSVRYVPRHRYKRHYRHRVRTYRHHHVRRHHHNRVRYHNNVRPGYRNHRHQPRLKRRTVRRTYDNRGNLRRRVTTRRYY